MPIGECHGRLANVIQQSLDRCPCCAYRTGCTTCPVCFWTDDGQRDADAGTVAGGPNGDVSLSDAQLNFAIYGASHPRYVDVVRPPRSDELP
ncbi:CPCC family cysteine-rich protein [Micromonospora sp. NPDC006431]|uniref:CPCC family cysteine-rich protein n=1 Tax=Micromonospora sp. NPDC006431 TaxID=3364235 RepID=UPI00368FB13D